MMRRLLTFVAAMAMLVPAGSKAGVDSVTIAPRGTGILTSPNVSLVASIPDTGAVGGRFVGNYFFYTNYTGLRILDVTNPEIPLPAGALTLPLWENEDVDVSLSRRLVLMTVDNVSSNIGGGLYVVSWMDVHAPQLLAFLPYPAATSNRQGGPGHIANCIADCARYAYITGARNGSLYVVDLANPAAPSIAGTISNSVVHAGTGANGFTGGVVHNIDTDSSGNVWATGSGGTSMLDVSNPLAPVEKYSTTKADNTAHDQFIHHNSLRLDNQTVLITEEDWMQPMCGSSLSGEQGGFQTWKIPSAATGTLSFQDQWTTELGRWVDGGAAATVTCSSHWFTFNSNKIVAVGWYDQGVRFLDVSNPADIRQVGYWSRPSEGLGASAGLFVPGRADIAYVPDYERGIDILKIDNGGAGAPTVAAPIRREWITPGFTFNVAPDRKFGWACLRPVPVPARPV